MDISSLVEITLLLVFLGYAVYAQARDAKEHDDLREESEARWKRVEDSMRDIDARIQTAHQQIAELHRSTQIQFDGLARRHPGKVTGNQIVHRDESGKAYTLDELIADKQAAVLRQPVTEGAVLTVR